MADKPSDKDFLPWLITQNPSLVGFDSQDRKDRVREQVDRIMEVFTQLLPSNYASQVQGPHYTLRLQAAAERIADFQITAQEVLADGYWEYTRPEFLYQILGLMVFPDAETDGFPVIPGDLSYRDFLRRMVELLLAGATLPAVGTGLGLLTDATIQVLERGIEARTLGAGAAWGLDDQFTFEVNVTRVAGLDTNDVPLYAFPEEDLATLQENVRHVLKALKPAHTLYDYRYLFRDAFGDLFTDTASQDLQSYHYEDFRKFCLGRKEVTGTQGETLTDRSLFSDPNRDFSSIVAGAELVVSTGPNSTAASAADEGYIGHYRVVDILTFPVGDDTTARAYTTSPTALSGLATVSGDDIEDTSQDWSLAEEGEILTFSSGPNAGSYRLKTVLGSTGGLLGDPDTGSGTRVRVAPSLLRIQFYMPVAATGQSYTVVVDRLGVQEPRIVDDEDASVFFTP